MKRVNRPREQEPDASTTTGRFALYLAHLLTKRGITAAELAEAAGLHRATIFRWLRAERDPSLADLDAVAQALGFDDAWSLRPPKSFIDSLK